MVCAATGTAFLVVSRATAAPGRHFAIEIYCSDSWIDERYRGVDLVRGHPIPVGPLFVVGSLGRRRLASKTGLITSARTVVPRLNLTTPGSQIPLSRAAPFDAIYSQWKRTVLPAIVLVKRVPLYLVFYSSTTANTSDAGRNKAFVLNPKEPMQKESLRVIAFD
jgi:hypothetical protein